MNPLLIRSVTCALLAVILSACAPMGGRERGQDGGMDRSRNGLGERGSGPNGVQMVFDQMQGQLRDTAQELALNPKQAVLWEQYQEKVGALMSDLIRLEPYHPPGQTALQQLDARVDTVRNRLAAMEDLAASARRLYQSLDDGQRKIADRRLASTVPALYSGLGDLRGGTEREAPADRRREGRGGRGGMGGRMGSPVGSLP